MAVETADDRSFMLADFGETLTYTPSGGTASSIIGIFDNSYEAVDVGGSFAAAMQQPRVLVRSADVSGIAEGDTIVRSGATYIVRVVMPDGTGMTEIMLESA